jgi:hypothetical protein
VFDVTEAVYIRADCPNLVRVGPDAEQLHRPRRAAARRGGERTIHRGGEEGAPPKQCRLVVSTEVELRENVTAIEWVLEKPSKRRQSQQKRRNHAKLRSRGRRVTAFPKCRRRPADTRRGAVGAEQSIYVAHHRAGLPSRGERAMARRIPYRTAESVSVLLLIPHEIDQQWMSAARTNADSWRTSPE